MGEDVDDLLAVGGARIGHQTAVGERIVGETREVPGIGTSHF